MTAPTHEKKNLTNDFSFYPAWVVPSKPTILNTDNLNITLHDPWKRPPPDDRPERITKQTTKFWLEDVEPKKKKVPKL